MKITTSIAGQEYQADLSQGHCIGIALDFAGEQPNHFGVSNASREPVRGGDFVGDTTLGGSCNVDVITLTPHCNGTHTESVGHIVDEKPSIHQALKTILCPATLISVLPTDAPRCHDSYQPELEASDKVISKAILKSHLQPLNTEQLQALVVRTLPNKADKLAAVYGENRQPPFFTREAMEYLVELGVQHLLVDFPSIDKMYDQGLMTNHHLFWQVAETTHQLNDNTRTDKTVTEMVFVDNAIEDGLYLLNIQIAPFELDAAPSRPMLIELTPCD